MKPKTCFARKPLPAAAAMLLFPLLLPLLPTKTAAEASQQPAPAAARSDNSRAAPDTGFAARAEALLRAQATESLPEKIAWAERIKLGDPHKYIQPIIAAKLHFNPADAEALDAYRWIKTVDTAKIKGPKDRGMYHFSAIYKTRIFFTWEKTLPPDILAWFHENEGGHLALFRKGGTENHGMMSRTSGYLFAERFQKGGGDPDTDHKAYFTKFLRDECRKLYTIGMGEWDSSTYVTFTVTGWLNVYDFAADPQMKALAKAALDWYATAYALKSFHGVLTGPEARGFARAPVDANSDVLAWLWFGTAPSGFAPDLSPKKGAVRYSIAAALSTYRPDPIITRLARKEVPLPFQVRASKPAYYGYTQGNEFQERLYIADTFAMGTLYDSTPGDKTVGVIWPQTTQFKLTVRTDADTLTFGAANGYHRHFPVEGRSPYDQYHQEKGAMVNLCYVPASDAGGLAAARTLLAVPSSLAAPTITAGGWHVFTAGDTFVAALPLGSNPRFVDLADWSRRTQQGGNSAGIVKVAEYPNYRWLQNDGTLCGWIIETSTKSRYETLAQFVRALETQAKVDRSEFTPETRRLTYTSLYKDTIALRHTGGPGGKPDAWTNGKPVSFADWPVYESRYVQEPLKTGLLTVSDGARRMTVDFTGQWPVWKYDNETKENVSR